MEFPRSVENKNEKTLDRPPAIRYNTIRRRDEAE
jgi:hypothetical protein